MPKGRAQKTLGRLARAKAELAIIQPATIRSVTYKMFSKGDPDVPDMSESSVNRVEYVLGFGREDGMVPWSWIVDQGRQIEIQPSWANPTVYAEAVRDSYRRDRWQDQPVRLLLVSEKGTVAGVLRPVLRRYGVGFLPVTGYNSKTRTYDLAVESVKDDGRPLILLYAGDHDPSGRDMCDRDLPKRLKRYGGRAIIRRLAINVEDTEGLPPHTAEEKKTDPRYKWFVETYGNQCWELDALDPRVLRARVEEVIASYIDWEVWSRAETVEQVETISLNDVLDEWQALSVFSTSAENTGGAA